jgi:hypothetical protein
MRTAEKGAGQLTTLCLALVACNDPATEAAYSRLTQSSSPSNTALACSPDRFMGNETLVACCQDGLRNWATIDGHQAAYRIYDTPACREADGVGTNCGVGSEPFKPCAIGPCGARIEWRVMGDAVHIFEPGSKPSKCGWQVAGVRQCLIGCDWPAGATRWNPEPYTDQATYTGLVGACPYRRCLKGGTPSQ